MGLESSLCSPHPHLLSPSQLRSASLTRNVPEAIAHTDTPRAERQPVRHSRPSPTFYKAQCEGGMREDRQQGSQKSPPKRRGRDRWAAGRAAGSGTSQVM